MTSSSPKIPQQASFELDAPSRTRAVPSSNAHPVRKKKGKPRTVRSDDGAALSLRLLRRVAVERKTGLSRSSIYRLMAAGDFPLPVRLSTHAKAWVESEVDEWINERVSASRKDAQS